MKGAWGEAAACAWLERQGCRLCARNFRTRYGEIDIIAVCGAYLVFVEVKTRRDDRFAAACEYVTPAKQKKLTLAAEQWLQEHPTTLQPRFDVIEVYGTEPGRAPRICHLENAFGG